MKTFYFMSIVLKKIIGREGEGIVFHQISHFPKDPCLENIFFWESSCTPGAKGEHSLRQEREGEKWKLRGFAQGQTPPKRRSGGSISTPLWWHQHVPHPKRGPETGHRLLILSGIFLHVLALPPWCKMLLYYKLERVGWLERGICTWRCDLLQIEVKKVIFLSPTNLLLASRHDLCTAMMWM